MNICTLTAKVIYSSSLLDYKGQLLSQFIVCLPNSKKKWRYYKIQSIAKSRLSDYLLEISTIGKYCILEGYIYIKKNTMEDKKQLKWAKKNICMKIYKVHILS